MKTVFASSQFVFNQENLSLGVCKNFHIRKKIVFHSDCSNYSSLTLPLPGPHHCEIKQMPLAQSRVSKALCPVQFSHVFGMFVSLGNQTKGTGCVRGVGPVDNGWKGWEGAYCDRTEQSHCVSVLLLARIPPPAPSSRLTTVLDAQSTCSRQ